MEDEKRTLGVLVRAQSLPGRACVPLHLRERRLQAEKRPMATFEGAVVVAAEDRQGALDRVEIGHFVLETAPVCLSRAGTGLHSVEREEVEPRVIQGEAEHVADRSMPEGMARRELRVALQVALVKRVSLLAKGSDGALAGLPPEGDLRGGLGNRLQIETLLCREAPRQRCGVDGMVEQRGVSPIRGPG